MNDWLDVMLEEIARKQREAREAEEERKRREQEAEQTNDDQPR
ncbi:MAG TPA: hypothetical protein VK854_09150 [Woeseiaceae bacterium]|nr:hypothetical protein [Woeseiaceae bacterium]